MSNLCGRGHPSLTSAGRGNHGKKLVCLPKSDCLKPIGWTELLFESLIPILAWRCSCTCFVPYGSCTCFVSDGGDDCFVTWQDQKPIFLAYGLV
ncbi:hypothetical protein EJB05_52802, partial [Eragrostis curvula]